MKTRIFSAFLTLVMLLTLIPATAVTAFAATEVPGGYTKVEYIESDGTGHIDTGWATADASESYAYEITFAPAETTPAASGTMFGAWSNISGVGGRIGLLSIRAKGTTRFGFGTASAGGTGSNVPYWTTTTEKQTAKAEVDLTSMTYSVTKDGSADGVTYAAGSISGSPLCEYSAYVFVTNRAGSAVSSEAAAGKVYGLKCWTDGDLVRDFVPVVDNATGVGGLYDLVNGKFHGAAGGVGVYGPTGAPETTVKFTTPSDVVLSVAKGFDDGGEAMTKTSATTEGDVTTHTYTLPVGAYRFLAMGENSVPSSKIEKYYNWDKNFVVSYADVLAGGKTINADPGLLANTGWEQNRTQPSYYVRQFTDEVLNNVEISGVTDEVKAKYPHVFTTPSFSSSKARHEYTTQTEMETMLSTLDAANANMYVYELGVSKDNLKIWAAFFTTTDLTGKTWQEAAQAVRANGKPTVQAQAQVHGDEQSGTEGALALINTLCNDTAWANATLSEVNVVVLPRMNPYGTKIYQYTSVMNGDGSINFNRDYMRLKENETNMLVALYNEMHPEVVIDMHEFRPITQSTEGALPDTKMAVTDSLNLPTKLVDLAYELVAYEEQELPKDNIRLGYYRDGATDTSPVNAKEYYSDRGSVGVLFEIPGQRKGKQQWDRRILSQFLGVKNIIDYVAADADNFKATVAEARAEMANYGKTFDADKKFVTHHVAGDKINYKAPIFDLVAGVTKNADNIGSVSKYNKVDQSRAMPIAYVIPKTAANIDAILALAAKHGVTYSEISADDTMELRQYQNYYRRNNSAGTAVEEGVELGEATLMSFDGGAYMFPVAQESSVVLMLLMEPDIRDASKNEDEWHKSSLVQQGLLDASDLYRCENMVEHTLTYVAAKGATCETDGNTEHYICACGAGFAANEHTDPLKQDSWVLPATGHSFVQQFDGVSAKFVCENNCGTENVSLNKVLAACDGVGGCVKVMGDINTESIVIPAGVTLDLDGHTLTAENLSVNEGGAVTNGSLAVSATATVSLGSNGGYVPVKTGDNTYALYSGAAKTGKDITYFDNGTKYTFGYKFDEFAAYAAAVAAGAENIKFGVNISLQSENIDADYSFSKESVDKMLEVGTGADDFFKVNLSLTGEKVDDVVATPYIKVTDLGFRLEGTKSTDYVPITNVAEYNGVKYTSLEAAIAAAEATGEFAEVYVIDDITYKRPTTIKLAGTVRLIVDSGNDITISGPVTFDGQNNSALTILFRVMGTGSKLTLDGATFLNYHVKGTSDSNKYYGCIARVQDTSVINANNVTMRNCSSELCGGFYATGTGTLNVTNSTFENNSAGSISYGGAISIHNSATVSVKNSTFTNNTAGVYGGAIGVRNCASVSLENLTMSGNVVGETANDLHVKAQNGAVTLNGTMAMEGISLESGMMLTTGDTFALATGTEVIVLDATKHEQVLTGGNVADDCTKFIGADGSAVDAEGYLGGKATVVYVAEVDGTKYEKLADAFAAANELTDSTVYVDLINDAHFDTATTVTFDPNVRIRVQQDITLSGKLTIDGGSVAHTTNPIVVVSAGSASAGHTLTLQGVTVQNVWRETAYGAAFRIENYGKIVLDGATVTGNKGGVGVAYMGTGAALEIKNNSVISNNTSTNTTSVKPYGGVIHADYAGCSVVASDSTFSGNTGAGRGAVACLLGTKSSFTNCTFKNNGGAALGVIHVRQASGGTTTLPITGCTFENNTTTATNGAAIYSVNGTTTVTNSTFTGNTKNVHIEGGTVNGVTN